MDCQSFDRWLNEGLPDARRRDAHLHADSCARCGAELASARDVAAALSQRFATAPDTFTDRVLARIATEEQPRPLVTPPVVEPSFAWWIRALLDPAVVLSCLLAAIVLATAPQVFAAIQSWTPVVPNVGFTWDWVTTPALSWLTVPILALPLWAVVSIALFRGTLRWSDRQTP